MKKALALLLAALLLLSGAALAEEEGITLRFIRVGNDTCLLYTSLPPGRMPGRGDN